MLEFDLRPLLRVILLAVHYGPEQPRIQNEVLGHSLVRSLALLTHSLARSAHSFAWYALIASLTRSAALTHFAHSLACGTVND